jgi:hypothetical protein
MPHPHLADVERWAEIEVIEARTGSESRLRVVLHAIEREFGRGHDNDIGELIAVSFLEHLPRTGDPASELRSLVGPMCAKELDSLG